MAQVTAQAVHEDNEEQQNQQQQPEQPTQPEAGADMEHCQLPSKCDFCGHWCEFKKLRMMGKQGGGKWKCLSCKAGQEALAKLTNGWPPKGCSDFSEDEQQAIMQQSHDPDPPMVSKTS